MPNIAITLPQLMYYAVGDKVRRERRWTSAECNSRPRICSLDRRSCVLSDQKAEREIACSQSSKDVAKVIGKYEPIPFQWPNETHRSLRSLLGQSCEIFVDTL